MLDSTHAHEEVRADIERLIWSASLMCVPRFRHQRHWEAENAAEDTRLRVCGSFRLENVAEHSWHLCDSVTVVGPRFPQVDVGRCLVLATLHDLLEIETGDFDPIGVFDGEDTHAFCSEKSRLKDRVELDAIRKLRSKFPSMTDFQTEAIIEYMRGSTIDSQFVKAMDKIQALVMITTVRLGIGLDLDHIRFTEEYCGKKISSNFPGLMPYFSHLMDRIRSLPEEEHARSRFSLGRTQQNEDASLLKGCE